MKPDKTITTAAVTTKPNVRWFHISALALAVAVAGCASNRDKSALIGGVSVSSAPKTVGQLARRNIHLEKQTLDEVPAEQVISTYRDALSLFSTPEQRTDALRRMADITMVAASESSLAAGLDDTEQPGVDTAAKRDPNINYSKAIELYEDQIQHAPAGADLSDTYYLLAKAYDLNAEPERALAALDTLAERYPKSPLMDEVQFRRGEQYFVLGRYDDAIKAYKAVLAIGPKSSYYENALYKYGWSLYKQGEYEQAIDQFVALLDIYLPPPVAKVEEKTADKAGAAKDKRGAAVVAKADAKTDAKPDSKTTGKRTSLFGSPTAEAATPTSPAANASTAANSPAPGTTTAASTQAINGAPATASTGGTPAATESKPNTREDARAATRRQLQEDTLRVTALAFSNLEGPPSIASYFAKKGERHYEDRLYESLAQLYVFQERYRDAADAYGAFVDKHPLAPSAPALSSKKIEVYAKGGFPSLVLSEKQSFVQHYGVFSPYWKQSTPETRQGYSDELKRHLVELAQHYHAEAQAGKDPKQYMDAARWYREYLATFPKDKNAPLMNSLLGEVLYAAEDYQSAIEEFERTAYDYDAHENAQKAGYFALLSYEGMLKKMPKNSPEREGWVTKEIGSSLRFIKAYPSDEHVPELMENVLDSQLALNDMKGAQITADLIIKRVPPSPQPLYEKAWMVLANAQFDEGNYQAAEASITKILGFASLSGAERKIYKDRHATAIYKQAELLEKEGMKAEAAKQYQKVASAEPESDVRAKADYDAANLLMETQQYGEAVKVLENFRRVFPNHELAKSVPAKLSIAYEKMGNVDGSARELEQVATLNHDNSELASQALTQAAEMQEKKGNRKEAIRLYSQLEAQKNLQAPQRIELQYKLSKLNEADGNNTQRDAWLGKVLATYQGAGSQNTNRTRLLAAEASFHNAEPLYQQYTAIRLTQPLANSIKQKKAAMNTVLNAYAATAEIGVLQYTTAATYRLGEAYHNFAKSILESERPQGMAEDALEEYQLLLEDQANPMQDKAIEILQANTNRVKDGAWDEWIQKSYNSLGELQPGRYKKPELGEDYVDAIY